MAKVTIPCLVGKTAKTTGITSWYWQPSKTLKDAGFTAEPLGKDEGKAIARARELNQQVEQWKAGGEVRAQIERRRQAGTVGALVQRYRKDVLHGTRPDGSPRLAPKTVKLYRTGLDRIEAWAGKHPLTYVTPARVRALRDQCLPTLGHHPTHQLLKMGRTLFQHAIGWDLLPPGANPFQNFDLATPDARDVIWSPAAREAMIAAAHAAGKPSIALAIMLGFAIGQRQADILALTPQQYVAIPEHKMQPEDYTTLAGIAPDGVPRGIRVRQNKTRAWIEVPVVSEVRAAIEANIARAIAADRLTVILDDTRQEAGRVATYAGEAGQTRFQRDFAAVRSQAAEKAMKAQEGPLAAELDTIQFLDLRRTCVVYLGELGLDAHLIAAITGHDIDETQRILKVYMPRTTGRAARAIAMASLRQAKEAEREKKA